ncbi:hypothetical protein [Pseudoalteromonas sp. A757]|uniref:hypothetical protein n=1 Tax=Pseudoalteromonas sp. A757 TaxID=2250709 RepID=UPI001F01AD2D|nr:hypothetical protein [Pseudoalteromonas sp. A757]
MKFVIVLLKELAEIIIRRYRLLINSLKTGKEADGVLNAINSLKSEGIAVEHDFFTAQECLNLRNKIDDLIASNSTNVWIDDEGADHRVYFVNEIDEEFNRFYENPKIRKILAKYTGTREPEGMLLAARIDAQDGNLGSGGGWHRDSPITHQFKAIAT